MVPEDLARLRVVAALDALGIGLARRHRTLLAVRRRPHHVARRRAVARVEEAWRPALGPKDLYGQALDLLLE
jgi:hypothetical protein